MKNHLLFLTLSCFVVLGSGLQSSEQEIFPFAENPELSWRQFERNFRETYRHLDAPKLILDNNCDFAPVYIWDPADKEEPPFVIMNTKTTGLTTPHQVEHVLLHEIGHHNYNAAQREQNYSRATCIADNVNVGINWAVKGLSLSLLFHNAYQLSQKTLSKKSIAYASDSFGNIHSNDKNTPRYRGFM